MLYSGGISILLLIALSGATEYGITGGRIAKPHSRPYMVSLQIQGQHVCGGILIRQDYILTAAHCKDCYQDITVVLGAHNISRKEKSQQRINVKKYHVHPQFISMNQTDYDIMLLKVSYILQLLQKCALSNIYSGSLINQVLSNISEKHTIQVTLCLLP